MYTVSSKYYVILYISCLLCIPCLLCNVCSECHLSVKFIQYTDGLYIPYTHHYTYKQGIKLCCISWQHEPYL